MGTSVVEHGRGGEASEEEAEAEAGEVLFLLFEGGLRHLAGLGLMGRIDVV